jgi:hypothetical protein
MRYPSAFLFRTKKKQAMNIEARRWQSRHITQMVDDWIAISITSTGKNFLVHDIAVQPW